MNIPPESIKIHGLTNLDLQKKPLFKEIVEDIYDFVGTEPYMISHNNIAFDKPFLESEMKRNLNCKLLQTGNSLIHCIL